jgi:hypothetical protein
MANLKLSLGDTYASILNPSLIMHLFCSASAGLCLCSCFPGLETEVGFLYSVPLLKPGTAAKADQAECKTQKAQIQPCRQYTYIHKHPL